MVRVKRPFCGCVISAASCFCRAATGWLASICPSSGNSHDACCVRPSDLSQRNTSSGLSATTAARP